MSEHMRACLRSNIELLRSFVKYNLHEGQSNCTLRPFNFLGFISPIFQKNLQIFLGMATIFFCSRTDHIYKERKSLVLNRKTKSNYVCKKVVYTIKQYSSY